MTSRVRYNGDLRTTATHILSGSSIETDAPVDNNGQGQRFSPSDLVATAAASCMCTIMGIVARRHNWNIDGIECEVEKIMIAEPRRIGTLNISLCLPASAPSDPRDRKILEQAAKTCPVMESIHPDIVTNISFNWLADQP